MSWVSPICDRHQESQPSATYVHRMPKKRALTILAGSLTLLGLTFAAHQNFQAPTLGVVNGKLKPLSSRPNGVSTQAADPAKLVETLPFKADTAQTMAAVKQAVQTYGGYEIESESENYLRVVFKTPTMGFRDDAEFWLDESESAVHFRSQSRLGYSDMGLNRARYQKLRESYLGL